MKLQQVRAAFQQLILFFTLGEEINLANALNLSESEDEEEMDTMIDDFGKADDVRVI